MFKRPGAGNPRRSVRPKYRNGPALTIVLPSGRAIGAVTAKKAKTPSLTEISPARRGAGRCTRPAAWGDFPAAIL